MVTPPQPSTQLVSNSQGIHVLLSTCSLETSRSLSERTAGLEASLLAGRGLAPVILTIGPRPASSLLGGSVILILPLQTAITLYIASGLLCECRQHC